MSKKKLILIGAVLVALCAAVLITFGQTYTVELKDYNVSQPIPTDTSMIRVEFSSEDPCVELEECFTEDGVLYLRFSSVKRGRTEVNLFFGEEPQVFFRLYTHLFGVITNDTLFGDSTGDIAIPIALTLFLAAALWFVIERYRADVRRSGVNNDIAQHGRFRSFNDLRYDPPGCHLIRSVSGCVRNTSRIASRYP